MLKQTLRIIAGVAMMAALVLLPLISGCGSQSPGSVAEKFINLLNERQYAEAYDLLAEASPARAISKDDFVSAMETNSPAEIKIDNLKISSEQIDGKKATVKWTGVIRQPDTPDENTEQELSLVQGDDGNWQVWE